MAFFQSKVTHVRTLRFCTAKILRRPNHWIFSFRWCTRPPNKWSYIASSVSITLFIDIILGAIFARVGISSVLYISDAEHSFGVRTKNHSNGFNVLLLHLKCLISSFDAYNGTLCYTFFLFAITCAHIFVHVTGCLLVLVPFIKMKIYRNYFSAMILHAEQTPFEWYNKISVNFTCVSMPQCLNTSVQHDNHKILARISSANSENIWKFCTNIWPTHFAFESFASAPMNLCVNAFRSKLNS